MTQIIRDNWGFFLLLTILYLPYFIPPLQPLIHGNLKKAIVKTFSLIRKILFWEQLSSFIKQNPGKILTGYVVLFQVTYIAYPNTYPAYIDKYVNLLIDDYRKEGKKDTSLLSDIQFLEEQKLIYSPKFFDPFSFLHILNQDKNKSNIVSDIIFKNHIKDNKYNMDNKLLENLNFNPNYNAKVGLFDILKNDFTYSNFRGSTISNSKLSATNFYNSNFGYSTLKEIDFSFSYLYNSNFEKAYLRENNFSWVVLTKANFTNAILSKNTDFSDATLVGTNFTNTENFDKAIFDGTIYNKQPIYLNKIDFNSANCWEVLEPLKHALGISVNEEFDISSLKDKIIPATIFPARFNPNNYKKIKLRDIWDKYSVPNECRLK